MDFLLSHITKKIKNVCVVQVWVRKRDRAADGLRRAVGKHQTGVGRASVLRCGVVAVIGTDASVQG